MRLLAGFPLFALLVGQAISVSVKYPYGKPYGENPYPTDDYSPPPQETYIPDDEPVHVQYGSDAYAKDEPFYPPPPLAYNDYVPDDVPYPSYVKKEKYADNYDKEYKPFITISTKDPELINHEYVSAAQFSEGRCRREVPAANFNATWYWSDFQAFIGAGSLSMQLTLRQIWLREARIPRHRLEFSVIPYPSHGIVWWTLLNDISLIQESRDIDPSTADVYTNYLTDNPVHKKLATRFIEKEHITVVLTDNKYYALLVRCLNDEHRDYMVMSTEPTLRFEHLQLIRNKITELGFNPDYFRVSPDYDHHPN